MISRHSSRLLPLLLLVLAWPLKAQEPVRYEARFDDADHHEASVTAVFTGVAPGALELLMSRSSPGRYALHEFAKNLYDLQAEDGAGRPLDVVRLDTNRWSVSGHDGTVVVRYRIFGNRCDGTYLAIDTTHAHMNLPATFLWARGLETRPIVLAIRPARPEWRVATQLAPTDDPFVFEAPDLDYFFDSPTEVGPFELHEWTTTLGGKSARMRLAIHHEGTEEEGARFAELAQSVVREHAAMFGDLPDFDYGTYTFIADYLSWANGDGMEHRNSTVLTSSRTIEDPVPNLGTVSHEFFHAWNVERMRPRSLEPFDFERANVSGELWFAEGFTSYYGDLALVRAGILDREAWARKLTGSLNAVVNAPGRRYRSPIEMSEQAPFVDAAVSIDPMNRTNTFVSYYSYGAVLALGLDLEIRTRFPERSLDDFMRASWLALGATERPYEVAELETLLAEVTSSDFAKEFFDRFVRESDLPDFETLLSRAGFLVRPLHPDGAWAGARVREEQGVLRISEPTPLGSPLYEAGLDRDDILLELDGRELEGALDWEETLEDARAGTRMPIVFEKRGGERRRGEIVFQSDPEVEVVTFERAGRELTPGVEAFRSGWLASSETKTVLATP